MIEQEAKQGAPFTGGPLPPESTATPTRQSSPGSSSALAAAWVKRLLDARTRDAPLGELVRLVQDAPVSDLMNIVRSAQR